VGKDLRLSLWMRDEIALEAIRLGGEGYAGIREERTVIDCGGGGPAGIHCMRQPCTTRVCFDSWMVLFLSMGFEKKCCRELTRKEKEGRCPRVVNSREGGA